MILTVNLYYEILYLALLTKNANPDKYSYSGYGIGFDVRGSFSLSDRIGFVKIVIILGVDNISSLGILMIEKRYINTW